MGSSQKEMLNRLRCGQLALLRIISPHIQLHRSFSSSGFHSYRSYSSSVILSVDTQGKSSSQAITFESLGLSSHFVKRLQEMGIIDPSEVQQKTCEDLLRGKSVVIAAQTGTGKTLAYLLPLLQTLSSIQLLSPRLVLLAPSRDLCTQIFALIEKLLRGFRPEAPLAVRMREGKQLFWDVTERSMGLDVVVTTPECLVTNLHARPDLLSSLKALVLDEADMLLTGTYYKFTTEALRLAKQSAHVTQRPLQVVFVGATFPDNTKSVTSYISRHFPKARWHRCSGLHARVASIEQQWVECADDASRASALLAALAKPALAAPAAPTERATRAVVFVNSVQAGERVLALLDLARTSLQASGTGVLGSARLFMASASAGERAATLQAMSAGEISILVATNAAARGLDLEVDLVVQYDFALNALDFLHRVGRTGRLAPRPLAVAGVNSPHSPPTPAIPAPRAVHLYGESNALLVRTIRGLEAEPTQGVGPSSLERAFSRKRSLRNKQRKKDPEVRKQRRQKASENREKREAGQLAASVDGANADRGHPFDPALRSAQQASARQPDDFTEEFEDRGAELKNERARAPQTDDEPDFETDTEEDQAVAREREELYAQYAHSSTAKTATRKESTSSERVGRRITGSKSI
jgi:superfamily II DNA/RNA helicase